MKFKIKIKKNLEETNAMSAGGVQGYGAPLGDPESNEAFNKKQEKDQRLKGDRLAEMYSTQGLAGKNKQQIISAEEEHAGYVKRSKDQGLQNVTEQERTQTIELSPDQDQINTAIDTLGNARQNMPKKALKAVTDAGYEIIGYLGGGQFGKVFKVNNPRHNREEAMKIVMGTPFAIDREVRNYDLVQQGRSQSEILAKHFPETYAAWKQDNFGFIAMEILEPVRYSDEAMLVDKTNLISRDEKDQVPESVPSNQSPKAKQWFSTEFMDSLRGNSSKVEAFALQGIQDPPDLDNGDLLYFTSPAFMSGLRSQFETKNPAFDDKVEEHLNNFLNNAQSFPQTSRILNIVKDETPDAPYVAVALGVIANVVMNIRGQALQDKGIQINFVELDRIMAGSLVTFVKGYREYSTMRLGYDVKGPDVATGSSTESWDKVAKELHDVTGLAPRDVHYGNIMQRPNGDLVIVDLGLFRNETDPKRMFESKKFQIKIKRKLLK